ncbi:MAG: cbb3-type cytochrome c oxidase subunit I [Thermomicrobiales bacterium]|nr:cbb3-type cytochrome c oxidase subunit I [Thermomicrobiales bacterium]
MASYASDTTELAGGSASPRYHGISGEVLHIAMVYLITGFVTFLAMGLLGLTMRLHHAGWLTLSPDWFYRIMTIHGAGMVAALLLAAMGGMIAVLNQTVRLSARWLLVAFQIYFMSLAFVLIAVLAGGFAGAWTALDPLPFHGLTWSVWAGVVMFVGFFCIAIGFLIYSLHLFFALRAKFGGVGNALGWPVLFGRKKSGAEGTPRPPELAAMVVAIVGILTGLSGIAVLVPLFADAAGVIAPINALYAKNFQMFFGHALANLSIYLGVGLVYATLPLLTNRPWASSRLVILAWNLVIILVIIPWSHHLYMDLAQPTPIQILGQVASYAIAPPLILVTILGVMTIVFRSGLRWTAPAILFVLGIWGWVFGGMGAVLDSTIAINNVTHNTMWVPAHFHTYYLLGVASFIWGYLFYLISDLGRLKADRFSAWAAWLYGVGAVGFVMMFYLAGAHSIPRRFDIRLPEWHIYAEIAVPFVVLLGLSILWLTIVMARGLKRAWRQTAAES